MSHTTTMREIALMATERHIAGIVEIVIRYLTPIRKTRETRKIIIARKTIVARKARIKRIILIRT
jgi:hypothetical protein